MANVVWQSGKVTREQRAQVLGHQGATLWLTGLPGAGKTTIAIALEEALIERGVAAYRLDGDNVRHGISADLGFSAADRDENIRRIGELAKLFADAGMVVLASFISPYESARARARKVHEDASITYLEVHVDCPLEVAEGRDPKGMYARARAGEIKGFTGIDAPYEAPKNPDIHLRTDLQSVEAEVEQLLEALVKENVIG